MEFPSEFPLSPVGIDFRSKMNRICAAGNRQMLYLTADSPEESKMNTTAKITVAGAGFAAITGIRELRKQLPGAELTLVAPKPEFVYLPSLIWVPYGMRKGDDLRYDIRPLLEKLNVNYMQAAVSGISADGRALETDAGTLENDALLIATGGRYIKKLPGIENAITICEGVEAAEKMGARLAGLDGGTIGLGFGGNPKEPSAMRGGPMFELLFGLDTWLKNRAHATSSAWYFLRPRQDPANAWAKKQWINC